jgi:hypothetical protein
MIIYVNYKIASTIVETKDSECKCIEKDTEMEIMSLFIMWACKVPSIHDEFRLCKSEQTAYNV